MTFDSMAVINFILTMTIVKNANLKTDFPFQISVKKKRSISLSGFYIWHPFACMQTFSSAGDKKAD